MPSVSWNLIHGKLRFYYVNNEPPQPHTSKDPLLCDKFYDINLCTNKLFFYISTTSCDGISDFVDFVHVTSRPVWTILERAIHTHAASCENRRTSYPSIRQYQGIRKWRNQPNITGIMSGGNPWWRTEGNGMLRHVMHWLCRNRSDTETEREREKSKKEHSFIG